MPRLGHEWKVPVNTQYQDAMKLLMNLVMAALVLPIAFVKAFVELHPGDTVSKYLGPMAYSSWALLCVSLLFGMVFYWASTKFMKVVSGGEESLSEQSLERIRDASIAGAVVCFGFGLLFVLFFLGTLHKAPERSDIPLGSRIAHRTPSLVHRVNETPGNHGFSVASTRRRPAGESAPLSISRLSVVCHR